MGILDGEIPLSSKSYRLASRSKTKKPLHTWTCDWFDCRGAERHLIIFISQEYTWHFVRKRGGVGLQGDGT